jgi:hypothetical protein
MNESLQTALDEARQPFADTRFHLCRLEIVESEGGYRLEGVALDEATRDGVLAQLRRRLPEGSWDAGDVRVLRSGQPRYRIVATNLTGWQRDPSWLGEQQSQTLNGARVEILEPGERWSLGRLDDGYIGYVYTSYLGPAESAVEASHMVAAPVVPLWQEPAVGAPLVGRVFAGTRVAATAQPGGWAEVRLAGGLCGYAVAEDLRPLPITGTAGARRAQLIADAHRYIGVPYLWGGTTTLGIDCSGFAQLMHKLAGVEIPRDADMQFDAGQPVEPPFAAGDLLYFGGSGGHRSISHVGISLGADEDPDGWRMIHSGRSRNGVYVDDVQAVDSLRESFQGARRFI